MPTSRVGASVRVSGGGMSKPMPEARRVTSASKMRLQAREAVAKTTEDNSDLIDFIRQGPPSAREKPRIPRSVAPFRNTMDSDQMSGAVGGRAVDANLPNIRTSLASTNVTDMSMPSVHSSINSRSELIKKTTTSSSVNKPLPNANDFDDSADMMPKRKTRRARDPYAIDFSDDDEEDDVADRGAGGGRQPAQREESLIDFLRSVPPPESNSPSVPFDIPQTRQPIKKKASAPSLMSRFGRGSGLSPTNANFSSANGAGSSAARSGAASNVNGGSRPGTGRGYIPIQVNMPPGLDIYGTNGLLNQPTANVSSSAYRTGGGSSTTTTTTTGRVAMKKFEPREPVSKGTRTSELADFLRTSAPPPSVEPSMPSPSSDDGRVRGMFGARKKAAYA